MEQEHPKAPLGYLLAIISGFLAATGTTVQKMAMPPSIELTIGQLRELISDPSFILLLAGVGMTFIASCLVVFSFKFGRSNILYSMMGGVSSVGIVVMPFLLLGEKITVPTFAGMVIIVSGVVLMGIKFPGNIWKRKSECNGKDTPRK